MSAQGIPEIAQWLRDSARSCDDLVNKSNNLSLALFVDPVEKIGQDSVLYLQGRLPATSYSRQSAIAGGLLLTSWAEVKKDSHGGLRPEVAAAMKAFTDSAKGDEKSV